jgi:spectrin alpha
LITFSGDDFGENLAAVQGMIKKHEAFETDFSVHRDRCQDIQKAGEKLIEQVRKSNVKASQF